MSDRLDVLVVTKYQDKATGEDKNRWTKVGAAFSTKTGGWSIKLDLPVVIVPGVSDLVLAVPKAKGNEPF